MHEAAGLITSWISALLSETGHYILALVCIHLLKNNNLRKLKAVYPAYLAGLLLGILQ